MNVNNVSRQSFAGSYKYPDKLMSNLALRSLKVSDREAAQKYATNLEGFIKNNTPDDRKYNIEFTTDSSVRINNPDKFIYTGKKFFNIKVTDVTNKKAPKIYGDSALIKQNVQIPPGVEFAAKRLPVKQNLQNSFESVMKQIKASIKMK